jgi:acetoin utilization deacetylase AcuC-like enzyme
MKVFWDPDCLLHNPPYEIVSGEKIPYVESPDRLRVIKKALEDHPSSFTFESTSLSSQDITHCVEMVHSREYLNYLSHAYDNWVRTGGSTVTLPTFPDDGPPNHYHTVYFPIRRPYYLNYFFIRRCFLDQVRLRLIPSLPVLKQVRRHYGTYVLLSTF